MCVSIMFDGALCETIGELRSAIAPHAPVIRPGYPPAAKDAHCCCCPVDVIATAEAVGRVACQRVDDDPMVFWFLPAGQIPGEFCVYEKDIDE